ncbi:MAG: hypothetical protein KGZ25_15215, partial [Planctomycetes bacterium]|nr:hypothetical protein [Planctomycetota bacterium]
VQKPIELEGPRKIVFGLMASPGKPLPENWRKILFQRRYKDYPTIYWQGSTYWGCAESMSETYPLGGDMSTLNKMQEARLTGDRNVYRPFIGAWSKRHLEGEWPESGRKLKTPEQAKKLAIHSIRHAASAGQNDFLNVYWEEFHGVSRNHPETQVFKNEWSGRYGYGGVHPLAPSYLDFQCWYGAEFIRRGIGLYFDNTFPKQGKDPVTTNAYRLPNGSIQASANMWRHREYLKRIWILHQQLAPAKTKPIMMLHMTNSHVLPYMVFNQSNLDLEWFYGPDPQQSKYDHALLRAESLGRQTGSIPLVLAHTGRHSKKGKTVGERTKFGTMFVHEIKFRYRNASGPLMEKVLDFGYGREDCEVFNYWEPDYPLSVSSDDAKSIVLRRGGEAMIVVATWSDKPEKVTFDVKSRVLKMRPKSLVNAESGDAVPLAGNKFDLDLPAYGVRILHLK